ncbi:hypothetical protein SPF06_20755 [Sinomonas sp. JGH33]|uniref:Uncharacterized protein n=1 Tax=Sinomonas terricola TaxID=3110330 RepID=A0ABU5TBT6_9MICC|nr:hypothetical protein [Sinomonas sp. JGH33]MEA5457158.1 hypothetical protein [Sinomonas sp. JGH33]
MSHEPLDDQAAPSGHRPPGVVDRALSVLEEARSLPGAERAEAFERFHDALAAALDEESGE